jgi:hypothetical protein
MGRRPRCTAPEKAVGKSVRVPARLFGDAWARKEYGKEWKTATLEGEITSYVPKGTAAARGPSKYDVWNLMFPGDVCSYPQKWAGICKWLSEEDLEDITGKITKIQKVRSRFPCVYCRFADLG